MTNIKSPPPRDIVVGERVSTTSGETIEVYEGHGGQMRQSLFGKIFG